MCSTILSPYHVDTTSASHNTGMLMSKVSVPCVKMSLTEGLSVHSYQRWLICSDSQLYRKPEAAQSKKVPIQEKSCVMSALEPNWNPVWFVWHPTVTLTWSHITESQAWKDMSWLILRITWKTDCVRGMVDFWRCSARWIRCVCVSSAPSQITGHMSLSPWQKNMMQRKLNWGT